MPATDALSSYRDLSILVVFEAFVSYPVRILGAKLGISRHENSSSSSSSSSSASASASASYIYITYFKSLQVLNASVELERHDDPPKKTKALGFCGPRRQSDPHSHAVILDPFFGRSAMPRA